MKKKYFGTDGIRGRVNQGNINGNMFFKFGLAVGTYFKNQKKFKQTAIIAKDTRLSGYTLEPALVSGLASAGMHVFTLGPLPTNGLAMLTKLMKANMGIMITASHNPYYDNGLKLFGPDGLKLSDKIEKKIEGIIDKKIDAQLSKPKILGRVKRLENGNEEYIKILKKNFPKSFSLKGTKIVIDCANGAAYKVAPTVLQELGAEVVPLGVTPDGININKGCGSTNTKLMTDTVVSIGADVGIALDGDADRLLIADENGKLVDGDLIIGVIATSWKKENRLIGKRVVATVMSNSGLDDYLLDEGLTLDRVQVGDRHVVQRMRSEKLNLGGEQSGHIILSDHNATGDGLVTVVRILSMLSERGKAASEVCRMFTPLPQRLINIPCLSPDVLEKHEVESVISDCQDKLAGMGRLLVRYSGTEAAVRIMVEAEEERMVHSVTQAIAGVVEESVQNSFDGME